MTHFNKALKLFPSIQKVTQLQPHIYKIGLEKSFIDKFSNYGKYLECIELFKPTFSTFIDKNEYVNSNEIIGSLYDNILMNQYLFYSPFKGKVISRNEYLLKNINTIYNNVDEDNWLIKIKTDDPNTIYSGYF